MSTKMKLAPSDVTDAAVLAKCKQAMNEWSAGLAFTMTKTLGTDATITKAVMYHAYEFKLESKWTHREFTLEDSGTPVADPKDIDSYDLWDTGLHGMDGDCHLELSDTCYKTTCEKCEGHGEHTCEECHGQGKVDCPDCHGDRKVTCSKCDGSGRTKCHTCWGKGEIACKVCSGQFRSWDTPKTSQCPHCHGSGKQTCTSCHGEGTHVCSECHGKGEVTCEKCDGKGIIVCEECGGCGIVTCKECEGRGWNPHVWYLTQEQKSDEVSQQWFDEGIAGRKDDEDYSNYTATAVIEDEKYDGQRTQQKLADSLDAPFVEELLTLWKDSDAKLEMETGKHDADKFRYQHAILKQYDAVMRVEYTYRDKPYVIWVDLCGNNVYEGPEGGLMAEWSKEIAQGGDAAAAKGDTPEAMYNYAMACVISDQDADISIRANKFINRQAWYFRGAMALTMMIWWGGYCWLTHGSAKGLAAGLVAALIYAAGDWLSMRRPIWQLIFGNLLVLGAGMSGYTSIFSETGYVGEAQQQFVLACSLAGGSLALLLGHDFGLRLRYKGIAHKYLMMGLGAIAGWASAPAIKFGCSASGNTQLTSGMAVGVAMLVFAGAAWRTKGRLRIMDCGKWVDGMKAEKQRAFVGSFKELQPTWLMPTVFGALLAWIPISLILGFALPKTDPVKAASVGAGGGTNIVAAVSMETNVETTVSSETNVVSECVIGPQSEGTQTAVRKQSDDEVTARKKLDDARKQAEADALKRQQEAQEAARKQADEAAAARKKLDDARKQAEADALKRQQEAQEAARKQADEAAAARKKLENARKQAEADALKRQQEAQEAARKKAEEAAAARKKLDDARRQAEADALKRQQAAQESARKQADEAAAARNPPAEKSGSKTDTATDIKDAAKDAASSLIKSLW